MRHVVRPEDLVTQGPPREPARALELLGQLAQALDAAHEGGIVDPDLDLGPARLQYAAPEQLLGRAEGPRSDVYSLSAVLYRYLTGTVPFPRARGRAALFWHLHAPRPRPTAVRPGLPAAIDRVIARGMAIDPAARPPTAAALIEEARSALTAGLAAEPHGSRGTAGPARREAGPPAAKPQRRAPGSTRGSRRRLLMVGGIAALAVAGAGAGFVAAGALDDPPGASLMIAGRVQLVAPAEWRRLPQSAAPSSLRLADPVVLARAETPRARLVAGAATAVESVAVLARLQASPPAGELVSLGRAQARRYRAREAPGMTGPITLYVAPTNRGMATLACTANSASAAASFMPRCERLAASLRLAGGRFTGAGPSPRQATGQAGVFRRLNAARSSYKSRIRRSRTGAGLAAAARDLAFAHAREALVLRALDFTGIARPGGRASVRALQRAADIYDALAAAAAHGDRREYAGARRSALAADAAIRRALRMLQVVGYAG